MSQDLTHYIGARVEPTSFLLKFEETRWSFGGVVPVYRVGIPPDEYRECVKSSLILNCSTKTGKWGRGYRNTEDDPRHVERAGKLGEVAWSKIFGTSVDMTKLPDGKSDEFDTVFLGVTIDVKTSLDRLYDYSVQYIDNHGNDKPLSSEMYVFAFMESEDRTKEVASVVFVGWATRTELLVGRKKVKSVWDEKRKCEEQWGNCVVTFKELHPMTELPPPI